MPNWVALLKDQVANPADFTPTVSLVGGAGNTTPVYTTNTGRFSRYGKKVDVDVLLTGDGGAEGAGTGKINVLLPQTAGASQSVGKFPCGYYFNNGVESTLLGEIAASGTTIALSHGAGFTDSTDSDTPFTGVHQSAIDREVRLCFNFEID